jgi:hypothetical protein
MRALMIACLAVATLAATERHARAESDANADLVALLDVACAAGTKPVPASCARLAELRDTAYRSFPRQYYKLRYGLDVCADLQAVASKSNNPNLKQEISKACDLPAPHKTAALDATAIGVNLVQGLGDLLVAEAKESALEYLLTQVGKRFCTHVIVVDKKAGLSIALGDWFKNSCEVMLPNGEIDVDAFSFGALKIAFHEDLTHLPRNVGELAGAWIKIKWPGGERYAEAIAVIAFVAYELGQGTQPLEILKALADEADRRLKGKLTCDLTTPQTRTKECALILGLELARTAANEKDVKRIATLLAHAIDQFCTDYGAEGLKTDGKCVINPGTYEQLHTDLLEVYRAAKRLLDLQTKMSSIDALPNEVGKRAAPEWSHALRQLSDALGKLAIDVDPGHAPQVQKDFALLDLGFDAFDAVIADDPAALRKAVLAILATFSARLDADLVHAITVVVSLATAKDRTEVKAILAEVTAPVGTYKIKYRTTRPVWMIDGFVGFFAGSEVRIHRRNADGSHRDAGLDHRSALPLQLSAPVGVDLTARSHLGCRDWFHVGATVTLIDPLALAVSTAHDTISADWKTLFAPGLYLRVGLMKSPLTLLIGGNFQWARRGEENGCGTQRCFDGAFQLGAGLSIDVPLFMLR